MKKFGAGLLAAALLLSGCQREAPAEGPTLTDDIDYMPVVEATDLASAGITLAGDLHGVPSRARTEITEQGIFFFDWDAGLLMFNDWQTNATYPLCAKANCTHSDAGCNAWFDNAAGTPSGMHSDGDRLYYFTTNYPAACYVQDFDGENRREVFSFEGDIYPQFVYEGDSVYFVANGYQMNAEPDETGSTVAVGGDQILRADLQTGALETIPLTLPDDTGKITRLAITGKYGDSLCLYYEEIDRGLFANFLQNLERTRFLLDLETGQIQGMMEDRKRANQMSSSDGTACGLYAYLDIDWDTEKSFTLGSHTADAADGVPILIDFANGVEYHFPSQPSLSVGFSLHDGKLFYTRPADDGQSLRLFYFDFETQTEQTVPNFFQDYVISEETENWFVLFPRQDGDALPTNYRVLKSDYFAGNPALIEMGEIQL